MEDREKIVNLAELLSEPGIDQEEIEKAIGAVIKATGEDPEREGMKRTPERVAKMFEELLAGYRVDPFEMLNEAVFEIENDDMVIVQNIEFYSLCEHHMIPFFGRAHVAYIPNGKIIGLSKIPGIVDMFAKRFQVQERLTRQIADMMTELLKPQGVAVILEGTHLCTIMRGVKKHNPIMTTSALVGVFQDDQATRQEFLEGIARGTDRLRI
jgi:GTP cyclohydrolase I